MKIFIDINDKKIQSVNKSEKNYYLLYFKDIEIKDEFKEYDFTIVNDINVKLSMKVKNKFNSEKVGNLFTKFQPVQNKKEENIAPKSVIGTGVNMKERLAMFGKNKKENNEVKNTPVPKKLKLPTNFLTNNPEITPNANKVQNTNKNENVRDSINEVKTEKIEENINKEEIINENEENKVNEEKKECIKSPENNEEIQDNNQLEENEINNNVTEEKNNIEELEDNEKDKEVNEIKEVKEENDDGNKMQDNFIDDLYEPIEEDEEEKVDNININIELKKNSTVKLNEHNNNKNTNYKKRPSFLGNFINPLSLDKNEDDKNRLSKCQNEKAPQSKKEVNKSLSILEKSNALKNLLTKGNNVKTQDNNNKNNDTINNKSVDFDKRNASLNAVVSTNSKKKLEETYGMTPTSSSQYVEKEDNDDMSNRTTSTEYSSCRSLVNSPEIILDSMNFDKFLEQQKQKTEKGEKQNESTPTRESFCAGFFLASYPYKNGQVIENSNNNNYPALCHHDNCSKLNAMKPEILFRYPLKDTKDLELNNLAATICFPIGIKVCYSQTGPFKCDKDYITNITNQKGEKYYMMTYHFYLKMMNSDFSKKYEMNPLKHNLMRFGDAYLTYREDEFTDAIVEKIQKNLEYCQDLGFREYVYIPYCLCLISKFPYFSEMEKCLQSIFIMLSQTEQIDNYSINDEIMYFIHSIPIPDKNSIVKFYIPYYNKALYLRNTVVNGLNVMNKDYAKLTTIFSISNIIIIFRLLLSEKKVLFIDDDYSLLSKVTDAFISLLYPITWIHTYIPIMSEQMLKYLESFLPFLNGIHISMMTLVKNIFNEGEMDESEEVFLVYIKQNEIQIGSSLKNKKIKMSKHIQNHVLALPTSVEKELKKKLTDVKDKYDSYLKTIKKKNNNIDLSQLDYKFREAFIDVFVYLFHDYQKYIGLLDDDEVIFNKNLFIQEAKKDDRNFLKNFLESQLFEQFTQNILTSDMTFFNKKISSYGKKIKDKDKDLLSISSNIFYSDRNYLIKPDFLKLEDDDNNVALEKSMTERFKITYKTDAKGIILPQERIITNLNLISNEKYNSSNCFIYLLPEKKEIIQINKQEKEEQDNYRKELLKKINERRILSGQLGDARRKQTHVGGVLREGNLTNKKKEMIKDEIKEWVIKIFKSEVEDYKDNPKIKTDVLSLINNQFGIKCFVDLISHNKQGQITMLQKSSFKLLGFIIYNALLFLLNYEESDEVIEECVLLFKNTKSYSVSVSGKNRTLMDSINFKTNLKKYVKINQKNFWMKWFNIDLKEKQNKKKEENEGIDIDEEDDLKQKTLFSICLSMIDLEIQKVTIKNICDEINAKIFGKDSELGKQVQEVYLKYISSAKYASKI